MLIKAAYKGKLELPEEEAVVIKQLSEQVLRLKNNQGTEVRGSIHRRSPIADPNVIYPFDNSPTSQPLRRSVRASVAPPRYDGNIGR